MTREETVKVLGTFKIAYPNSFKNLTMTDGQAMVALWERQFADYRYEEVIAGADSYISTNTSGFPPSVGQLKEIIYKLSHPQEMSAFEAWNTIRKAISNSGWDAVEEFQKLPEICKRIVGSPDMLAKWSQTDSDKVSTVIQSNCIKAYNSMIAEKRQQDMLPGEVKKLIGGIKQIED